MVDQEIVLRTEQGYGKSLPPTLLATVLDSIAHQARSATAMGLAGASRLTGRTPAWLNAATDIRFVGHSGRSETVLHFRAPKLGEAAGAVYAQTEMWDARPQPDWTALDVYAQALADIDREKQDSFRFDPALLQEAERFTKVFRKGVLELDLSTLESTKSDAHAHLVGSSVDKIQRLRVSTPATQQIRVDGHLDMIRISTLSFEVVVKSGERVKGVLQAGAAETLSKLANQQVSIAGVAVFRPSGKLLRIDASSIQAIEKPASIWSRVPVAIGGSIRMSELRVRQGPRSGAAKIRGILADDPNLHQILAALEELS